MEVRKYHIGTIIIIYVENEDVSKKEKGKYFGRLENEIGDANKI